MLIIFYFLVLTKQQKDVEFDNYYYWSSIDQTSNQIIYRIQNLTFPYYYVSTTLFQDDLSFILFYDFNKIPNLTTSFGDYISYYEKRRTRFLKIASNGKIIYITTYSNSNQGKYNITIWGSQDAYCDNGCSKNGICYKDGCDCNYGYIGSDCHQTALEIQENLSEITFQGDEVQFFYLNLNHYKDLEMQLTLSTNSQQGIQVIMQLTPALIIPSSISLSNEKSYIKLYQIYDTQPIDLIFFGINPAKNDAKLTFAAIPINNVLNTIVSTLTIKFIKFDKPENTDPLLLIILIVVLIAIVIVIIVIIYCVCKTIKEKQRLAQLMGNIQQGSQNIRQQQQQIIYDLLTPIPQENYNSEDTCTICLDNLNTNQEIKQTHCHHNFHSRCIKEWLWKNQRNCPVCRSNLEMQDINTRLFPNGI